VSKENARFSKDHEWLKTEGETGIVGISDYAQHELGDVVYVELPKVGAAYKKGDACCNIESVKAVSDVYAPASGTVLEVNPQLSDHPELINQSPFEDGWLFKIKLADPSELAQLLTAAQYEEYLQGISGE